MTSEGAGTIVAKGVCYVTTVEYDNGHGIPPEAGTLVYGIGGGLGVYTLTLNGLIDNTGYVYKAFIVNELNDFYYASNVEEFTTLITTTTTTTTTTRPPVVYSLSVRNSLPNLYMTNVTVNGMPLNVGNVVSGINQSGFIGAESNATITIAFSGTPDHQNLVIWTDLNPPEVITMHSEDGGYTRTRSFNNFLQITIVPF